MKSTALKFFIAFQLIVAQSFAAPGLSLQGRLLNPDGSETTAQDITFVVQIRSPGSENCLLFQEQHSISTSQTGGLFSITIGQGTRAAASVDGGYSLEQIFANRGTLDFSSVSSACAVGTSYTPGAKDERKLVYSFNDNSGSGWQTVPVMSINYVPMAIESLALGGYSSSNFLRVESAGAPAAAPALTPAQATELMNLLTAASTVYVKPGSAVFTAAPQWSGTPAAADDLVNKAYVDAQVSAGLPNVGTAGTYTKVTTDAQGRVTSGATLSETDIPSLTTAGKVDGGAINAGTIGGSASINTSGNILTSGTVSAGTISGNQLRLYNGADYVQFTAPALGGSNVTYTLPSTAGTSGYVLRTDGAGVLSWVSPTTGSVTSVTSGGAPITVGGTATAPTISIAQSNTTTSGYLSSADWNTFNNKLGTGSSFSGDVSGTSSTMSVDKIKGKDVVPVAYGTGQFLRYDGTNWVNAALTAGDIPAVDSAKITDGTIVNDDVSASANIARSKLASGSNNHVLINDGSGVMSSEAQLAVSRGGTGSSAFTANQMVVANGTGSALQSFTCTSGYVLSFGALGIAQCEDVNGASQLVRLDSSSNLNAPGNINMASSKHLGLSQHAADPNTTGWGNSEKGRTWFNSTSNQIKYWDGTGVQVLGAVGGAVTSVTSGGAPITVGGTATAPTISIAQSNTTTSGYLSSADWNTFNNKLGTGSSFSGDVSGTSSTMSVDKIKGKDVVPVAYGTGQFLRYDGTNWVNAALTAGDIPAVDSAKITDGTIVNDDVSASANIAATKLGTGVVDNTEFNYLNGVTSAIQTQLDARLPLAGGTMSGALNMGSENITNTGNIEIALQKNLQLGRYTNGEETNLLLGLGAGDKGRQWYNTDANQIKYWDGTGVQVLGAVGGAVTSVTSGGAPITVGGTATAPTISIAQSNTTTSGYLSSADWNTFNNKLGTGSSFSGDVSGTSSTMSVDKIKGKDVVPVAYGTGQFLRYDGTNWVNAALTAGDIPAVDSAKITDGTIVNDDVSASANIAATKLGTGVVDNTEFNYLNGVTSAIQTQLDARLPLAGGTMSGALNMGSENITNTGNIEIALQKNLQLGRYTNGEETNLLLGLGVGDKGRQWYNTDANQIKYWDGTGVQVLGAVGGAVTSVTSGGAPITVGGTATAPTISIAQSNTTTSGYLSSADWNTFNNKLGTGSSFSGDVSGTSSAMSVDKIKGKDVVPVAYGTGQFLRYDGTNWVNAALTAGDIPAVDSAKITDGTIVNDDVSASANIARSKLASGSNNHVLINDGSGVMSSEAQLAVSRGGTGLSSLGAHRVLVSNLAGDAISPMTCGLDQVIKFDGSGYATCGADVGSAGTPLSALTAAAATNTIDNTNYAQTWNWSTLNTQTAMSINANAVTTGSVLDIASSSASLNSTNGLLRVANTGASTTGTVARIQSNSTPGSGLTVLANGYVGVGVENPAARLTVAGVTSGNAIAVGTSTVGFSVDYQGSIYGMRNLTTLRHSSFGTGLDNFAGATAVVINPLASFTQALLDVQLGGNSKFYVANSGNVGIANTNPANAKLEIGTAGTSLGTMRLAGDTSGYVQIQPASAAGSWTFTLPADDGDNGYVLQTNGSGVTSWVAAPSGTPSLSALTAAAATNTIDNTNYAQTWNWSTLNTQTAMSINANAVTTGSVLDIASSSASLNSTNGLLRVANTGASTTGTVARIQSNSTTGSGLTVLASGNIGIGTSSPTSNLHVHSTGTSAASQFTTASTGALVSDGFHVGWDDALGAVLLNKETGSLVLGTSGAESMRINSSGNIGIANINPANAKLEIGTAGASLGTMRLAGDTSGYVQIQPASAAGSWTFTLPADDGDNGYVLQTNGSGVTSWVAQTSGASALDGLSDVKTDYATDFNIFIGDTAGAVVQAGAQNNIAIGSGALDALTTGDSNIAIGRNALSAVISHGNNIAIGKEALMSNGGGQYNVAVGNNALRLNSGSDFNTAVGNGALASSSATGNTGLGATALGANTTGANSVAVGRSALAANTTSSGQVAVGFEALSTAATATGNTAVGYQALKANANDGLYNTAVGYSALTAVTSGDQNIALGYFAGQSITTGSSNIAIGTTALSSVSTGTGNIGIGSDVMLNGTGSYNIGIGSRALRNTTGNENLALGFEAGDANTSGDSNIALGNYALKANTTGYSNTALGYKAGYTSNTANANVSGMYNTFIGFDSGPGTATQLSNSMALGNGSRVTASNQVVIGNTSVTQTLLNGDVGIGELVPANKLDVDGDIRIGTGTTGCVYDSDGTNIAGTCSSDIRFKKDLRRMPAAADLVARLVPTYYKWRSDEFPEKHWGQQEDLGLIAQEVQAVDARLVDQDEDGYLKVKYNEITMYLVKAFGELFGDVKKLQTQNNELKARLQKVEVENTELKKYLCQKDNQAPFCN